MSPRPGAVPAMAGGEPAPAPRRVSAAGPGSAIVLALVELSGQDAPVVKATRELAGPSNGAVILLHVAPPVGYRPGQDARREHMARIDIAAQRLLRRLARSLLRRHRHVRTAVRFGETIEQVARTAAAVGATVVVAASRPARWWAWWSRDRRLRRSLDVPVRLVVPGAGRDGSPGRTG